MKLETAATADQGGDPEVYGQPVRDSCNYLRQAFDRALPRMEQPTTGQEFRRRVG